MTSAAQLVAEYVERSDQQAFVPPDLEGLPFLCPLCLSRRDVTYERDA
jgi:hypothetical protein